MLNNIGLTGLILIGIVVFVVFRLFKSPTHARGDPPPMRSIEERLSEYEPQSKKSRSEQIPPIKGRCHAVDGDTIHIGSKKIRLAGINAPELTEPYGKQAKWAMVELCKGQTITAYPTGETSYDRLVAKCLLDDGRDLAAEMVKKELALDMPHFPDADYKHLETPRSRRKLRWRPKKKD